VAKPVPADFCLSIDPSVRRIDGGRVLVGGSPIRIVRLTDAGAHLVDRLAAGQPIGKRQSSQRLARRLLDAGMAHPRPPKSAFGPSDVTVVIPTFGDVDGLRATLTAVRRHEVAKVIVVDDATPLPEAERIEAVAHALGARYLRLPVNSGPSAARNLGLTAVGTPLVAFIDRDVVPEDGWLRCLVDHFADPAVVAVAPRIRPRSTGTTGAAPTDAAPNDTTPTGAAAGIRRWASRMVGRYEQSRSPLDLGPLEARVAPRTRVSYVPSTLLMARTEAVAGTGHFDETLRWGEDVDLVWRLAAAGHTVRYEPVSHAHHPVRTSIGAVLRQRFDYGTAAAPLARRHPGAVPPVAVSPWSAAAWLLAAAGQPVSALAVAAISTAQLPAKLGSLDRPWAEALRLAGGGTWHAWRPLANATTRTWWPVAMALALVSKRARIAVGVAVAATAGTDWWTSDRSLDPLSFTALHLADDVAYGAGVWVGCARHRCVTPLLPDFSAWPQRSGARPPDRIPSGGSPAPAAGADTAD